MRRFVLALAFCVLFSAPASAAKDAPAPDAEKPKVEVIEDQEAGVVRILIGGKEILVIDADGLHVNGDVVYSGNFTDTGPPPHGN